MFIHLSLHSYVHQYIKTYLKVDNPINPIKKTIHNQEDKKKSSKKKQIPLSRHSVKKCYIVIPYIQGICEGFI